MRCSTRITASCPPATGPSWSRRSGSRSPGSAGSSRICSTCPGSRPARRIRGRSCGRWTVSSRGRSVRSGRAARGSVVSLPDDLPPLRVDPAQIERALVNLLENALESSSASDPVEVTSERTGRRGRASRRATTGPGLDPRDIERIFEPFERGTGETKQGTGLGLAIAQGLRRGERRAPLGGAGRRPGRRARARAAARGRARRTSRRERHPRSSSSTTSRRSCARSRSRCTGRATTSRRRGRPARRSRAAAARPPEAVILDLLLPDGRGTDVCRELREWSHRADPRPLGRRGRGREGRGARRGRRRLRDEAVQRRGAARAATGGAAPLDARARAGDRDRRAACSTCEAPRHGRRRGRCR